MVEVEPKAKVEPAHLAFMKSLDQSSLKLLEDYQSSNEDDEERIRYVMYQRRRHKKRLKLL